LHFAVVSLYLINSFLKGADMTIIDGRKIAEEIIERLKHLTKPQKILAAILVGQNPASISFLRQKEKVARQLDIEFKIYKFNEKITTKELQREVALISAMPDIGGIVLQLPLPPHIDRQIVLNAISSQKDVDALKNDAKVMPLAAGVVKIILEKINFNPAKKKIVIVGRGLLVGQPVAQWLKNQAADLKIFGRDADKNEMAQALKDADIIISGVGQAGLIKCDSVKDGSVLIDFGYSIVDGKIKGDFDFDSCKNRTVLITPTPGGTGPILVACLFQNFYDLTRNP